MKTKKLLLTFALVGTIALKIDAQSIPNGNFETWTAATYEIPQNYVWTSNSDAFRKNLPFPIIKSTDAYHGNYSVKMTTLIANGDTLPGIFLNTDPKNGNPATWKGGFAYSQKPTGMRGYYKSAIASPDTGFVMAFFYKGGVNIGQYGFWFYGTHNTYTLFSFNFSPALPQTPDTVIFGAGSSNFGPNGNSPNMRNGSMLQLDSLSFTGVASQPALFNGDFESWQTTVLDLPASWFLNGGSSTALTGGAFKTTDAKKGNNAIELITYVGERNNNPVAQGGQISTGWEQNNCGGNCQEQGGYPFSKQIDTLAFWYKYAPIGNDVANVNLNFKKNHNSIWNTGTNLLASTNYQYMEIPFNIGQTPDSVIVDIQSTVWSDSALSYIGSDLKIDEIHFKSQPLNTGIFNYKIDNTISIYPNPSNGNFVIETNDMAKQTLQIYDINGKIVLSQNINGKANIDASSLREGFYNISIIRNEAVINKRLVIVK